MPSAFIALQHLVPQHALSRLAGRIAESRRPWLRDRLIRRFVAAFDVDMTQAARGIGDFASFNDFFTRELKPNARPLGDADAFILSPADGAISQLGPITEGRIVQAKGRDYTTAELLGCTAAEAARFNGGRFMTIYLSPRDYHRVHMPAAGTLTAAVYLPGTLFSVNQVTAGGVERLFSRNERLACQFDGPDGRFASVMVGAMIVAGIETVWHGRWPTHAPAPQREAFSAATAPSLAAGAEMGRFHLGSTVVLLFEPGRVAWLESLKPGDPLRMGQAIGHRTPDAR